MTTEPPVQKPDDVIPWISAHRAGTAERWSAQRATNDRVDARIERLEDGVRCLDVKVAKWSAISALVGAGVGAGAVQLLRYLTAGA